MGNELPILLGWKFFPDNSGAVIQVHSAQRVISHTETQRHGGQNNPGPSFFVASCLRVRIIWFRPKAGLGPSAAFEFTIFDLRLGIGFLRGVREAGGGSLN